ncbi:lipocalin/fatty-acid binding family protein [Kitasatospora mediocidica]|uniref:lipocalin/fatty-acid binding family protein n=1 Tax=Kitasatospora mediocidica TaxID=58352 RepID=UPI00056681ED|nr:lipocalin/fatty-acid binding family protein [Kitasatospora mediocidica]
MADLDTQPTGTFTLVSDDNYDEYLRARGADAVMIELARSVKPTVTIAVEGGSVRFTVGSAVKTLVWEFTPGQEQQIELMNGTSVKAVLTSERGQWIIRELGSPDTVQVWEMADGELRSTLTYGDVGCVRTYAAA